MGFVRKKNLQMTKKHVCLIQYENVNIIILKYDQKNP